MNFTQQELLRQFMKQLVYTRTEFVEKFLYPRFSVSLRTLTNWLLPTESKEFKKIPDLTYRELCAAYLNYVEYTPKNIRFIERTYTPGFTFDEPGNIITFPAIWYSNGYWDLNDEYLRSVLKPTPDNKLITESISFTQKEQKDNAFIFTDRHEYKLPHKIYGSNFWIHVMRFESEPEAVGAIRTYTQLSDNFTLSEGFGEVIFYEGAYYNLMAQAAPDWYDEPLIIYAYQGLHKIVTGEIYPETFLAVVTTTGEILEDIPRKKVESPLLNR